MTNQLDLSRKVSSDGKINKIIININNQINTIQHPQSDDQKKIEMVDEKINKSNNMKTHPNEFVEIRLNHNESNAKYNEKVLSASQNSLITNISRMLFSKNCGYFYIILIISTLILTVLSLSDYWFKYDVLNNLGLFVFEMLIFGISIADIFCRFYALVLFIYFSRKANISLNFF
jgi:hypothetical protein